MTNYPPTALEMSFMDALSRQALATRMGAEIDKDQRLIPHVSPTAENNLADKILTMQKALKVCRHMNRFATQTQHYA